MINKIYLFIVLFLSFDVYSSTELEKLMSDDNVWASPLGNYEGHRFSSLKLITNKNVKKLKVDWTFSTGVVRGHEGGPLVIDGIIYIHSPFPNKVFAISLEDQKIIWKYTPKQDTSIIAAMCCDTVNRGLSYGNGKIFLQQADSTLIALNAKTGNVVWKVINGNPKTGAVNTNAPQIFKDKVITGISGGEYGVRGYISAYHVDTGKLIWRGYSTGPDDEMLMSPTKTMTYSNGKMIPVGKNSSLKSWVKDQWKLGGGTTWGWYTYDPKLNLLYYGSGNPGAWNAIQRPGDNKWSMSIWARDLDTGEVKWVYQMTPHDQWDYDGVNESVLIDQKINNVMRQILVHFDRNGFVYILDRKTGELLSADKYDRTVNWASHIDIKSGRPVLNKQFSPETKGEDQETKGICPASVGTKDQQPVSFSPVTKLFYVPTNHVCMNSEPFSVEYTAGQPYVGVSTNMYPAIKSHGGLGNFIAWDPVSRKIVWSIPEKFSVWSGVLTTAGGVGFYGTLEGDFKAFDLKSGEILYKIKTPSGIVGNINTWTFKGKQYVGVLSGIGGWAGLGMAAGLTRNNDGLGTVGGYKELNKYTELGGVLTVFSLGN